MQNIKQDKNIDYNVIVCRYHEIATKGANRKIFEEQMMKNLRFLLRKLKKINIRKIRGRIWIEKNKQISFSPEELEIIKSAMSRAIGLESYSPGIICQPEINEISDIIKTISNKIIKPVIKQKKTVKFKIRAKRADKKFPLKSKNIEIKLASVIENLFPEKYLKVDLEKPDISFYCDIREKTAFVFLHKNKCPGGLPVGSNDALLSMLSGGIDSPVASYLAMKRGCNLNYITFHSFPYTPRQTVDKVEKLARELNKFQGNSKLFVCNISQFQKKVRDFCKSRFRTILYRRAMFRISRNVAEQENLNAIVSGESIGQVASQTISNLHTTHSVLDMLIVQPLIGADKQDIIRTARNIGTFEMSNEQVPDSCTVFAPNDPATKSKIHQLEKEEARIPEYNEILKKIISEIQIIHLN